MKITKELIKEMIEEEAAKSFGSEAETRASLSKDLRNRSKQVIQGDKVDNRERAIISRLEKKLTQLAAYDGVSLYANKSTPLLRKLDSLLDELMADQAEPQEEQP